MVTKTALIVFRKNPALAISFDVNRRKSLLSRLPRRATRVASSKQLHSSKTNHITKTVKIPNKKKSLLNRKRCFVLQQCHIALFVRASSTSLLDFLLSKSEMQLCSFNR